MQSLLTTTGLLLAALLIYKFRAPLLLLLRRFDERNRQRLFEEARDRHDSLAHFRHTLKLAEEQVENVGEVGVRDPITGRDVTRFTFEGEIFQTRVEAEAARQESIFAKARDFYVELPSALSRRGDGKIRHN